MATKASIFLNTRRITTKKMYKTYIEKYPDSNVAKNKDYNLFKKIVCDVHKEAVAECLNGGLYSFGVGCGALEITKYEKSTYIDDNGKVRGLSPDYGATRKNKAAGGNEVIYHTNSLICRWYWNKSGKGFVNRTGWQLAVTDGPKGISRLLHHHLENDKRASLKYRLNQFKFLKEE